MIKLPEWLEEQTRNEALVVWLANKRQWSEYEVFERAYEEWNKTGVDAGFAAYILDDTIPYWVVDYCRRNLESVAIKGID